MYDAQSRSRSNRSGNPFSSRFWFDLKFSEGHHVVSYLFSFLLVQIFAVDHMLFLFDKILIIHWCLNLHICCWFIACLLITGRLTVDSSTMLHPPICRKHKFWWKSPMFDNVWSLRSAPWVSAYQEVLEMDVVWVTFLPRFHEIHKSRCRMCRTNKKRGLQRPNIAKNAEIIATHWELAQTLVRRKMPFSLRYPVWLWEAVDPQLWRCDKSWHGSYPKFE